MTMKKILNSLLMATCLTLALGAVQAQDGGGREKIEAAKIAMITNRLNLTTDQAQVFWPVYNEYNNRKQELTRKMKQLNTESLRPNNDNVVDDLKEYNGIKQKLADLDDEYLNKFLKVISPTQLAELYKTEQMFNKMLLNRLKNN